MLVFENTHYDAEMLGKHGYVSNNVSTVKNKGENKNHFDISDRGTNDLIPVKCSINEGDQICFNVAGVLTL